MVDNPSRTAAIACQSIGTLICVGAFFLAFQHWLQRKSEEPAPGALPMALMPESPTQVKGVAEP